MDNINNAEQLAYELQDWVETNVVLVIDGESFKVNMEYNRAQDVIELSKGERVA